mmetsp:Transcript_16213/g.31391  ORF Transcript_16213/g.31391 Transcript_16213/m.31391 type:complete len:253 (-) Transcript_16213:497-1255(-)
MLGNTKRLRIGGMTKIARTPNPSNSIKALNTGFMKFHGVGSCRAPSSDNKTNAKISSKTAAAIISCPVGALSNLLARKTDREIPILVGDSEAPRTKLAFMSNPRICEPMRLPNAKGTMLPSTATRAPRRPMSRSISKSTSSPASITSNIKPTSPTSFQAPTLGTKSTKLGPRIIPIIIWPTSGGALTRLANFPTTQSEIMNASEEYNSSHVKDSSSLSPVSKRPLHGSTCMKSCHIVTLRVVWCLAGSGRGF